MGIFNFRKKEKTSIIDVDEEVVAKKSATARRTAETKRLNQEIRDMEHQIEMAEMQLELKQKLERLQEFEEDDDMGEMAQGGKPEDILLMGLLSKLNNKEPSSPVAPIPVEPIGTSLSDEGIEELLKQTPQNYIKLAKVMPDNDVKKLVETNSPFKLTEETLIRIVAKIKNS